MSAGESIIRKLNDLEHRLGRTETWEQAVSGGGCAGPYIIAASDSTTTSQDCATVVCDGTADEAEINTGIALAAGFGFQVWLTEGTFNIASSILFSGADDRVWLRGYGRDATSIQCDSAQVGTSFDAIVLTNNFGSMITDMSINADVFDFGAGAGDGIRYSGTSNNIRLKNLYIDNPQNGIEIISTSQAIIRDVHIDSPQNRGILVSTLMSESVIEDVLVDGGVGTGFEYADLRYSTMQNCGVGNLTGNGILISAIRASWIKNNRVQGVSGTCMEITG